MHVLTETRGADGTLLHSGIFPLGAYVTYNASDFDATSHFYETILGCKASEMWDRDDGRGAYFELGGVSLVEILGAARGAPALGSPDTGSFMVVMVVADAQAALDLVGERGADTIEPMIEEPWGRYFGVRDPDGVPVYLLERSSIGTDQGSA